MAGNDNGWNSFMQSRQAQIFLYGICVFFCFFYAVGGIVEMTSPERSAAMIAQIGETGYYAMMIIRTVVLFATGLAFGRIVLKKIHEDE